MYIYISFFKLRNITLRFSIREIFTRYFQRKINFHFINVSTHFSDFSFQNLPIFFRKSKHVNISTEFHRLSLSTLAPSLSFFLHVFVHETMHERSPICQFVIPRGCIATRYASVALHKSRTFSRPIVRVRHCTRKPQTLQPKGKE